MEEYGKLVYLRGRRGLGEPRTTEEAGEGDPPWDSPPRGKNKS